MNKIAVANYVLTTGTLFVHLDPKVEGVEVPPWLKHQDHLVLQVGYNMPIPIPDLRVDGDGILGTLSFSQTPYTCFVPWRAVFCLAGEDGQGGAWPEAMPAAVAKKVEAEKKATKKKLPAGWAVVKGGKS